MDLHTDYINNSLVNKLIESPVPRACKDTSCIIGIDEAGRGPVLGPMTYAAAFFPQKFEATLAKMKFADSKALTESTREDLFEAIQKKSGFEDLGYVIKIISPNMISNSMLRRNKYNLNALSHDTAIDLIREVRNLGIDVKHVFIDTVGPAQKYHDKMRSFFPDILFTIAEKADSKYPIVSAASVCAKVTRDRIVRDWKFIEGESLHLDTFKLGSGYPADPDTKKFLDQSVDPVFGFPILARFSWSTITKALEKYGCNCDWNEPDDDADPKQLNKQQKLMKGFFARGKQVANKSSTKVPNKNLVTNMPRSQTTADKFFSDRLLKRVDSWN